MTTAWLRRREVPSTWIVLGAGLFFAFVFNTAFLHGTLADRNWAEPRTWLVAIAMVAIVASLHTALFALILVRPILRPALALLIVTGALVVHFNRRFGTVIDPTMLRNVLATDPAEAGELLDWALLPHLLLSVGLPLAVLFRFRPARIPFRRALASRAVLVAVSLLVLAGALMVSFRDFSSLMRNDRSLRYTITPANLLYAGARLMVDGTRVVAAQRTVVGADARLGPRWATTRRPVLFVLVVGETARAANWGLNGYARQTTPRLAALDVINFPDVTSCGTNTETSVPCMFSAIGRRDYDETRIRTSDSLLHVLHRAGLRTFWLDNQAGCKGVCDGLPKQTVDPARVPGLCADGRCLDEALLQGLDTLVGDAAGNLFLVLHTLGNHGPAYFKRYPPAFERFVPVCRSPNLQDCSRPEIVNAYDNALLYTDHVLAETIGWLTAKRDRYDTALLYVSDHGESLGEKGLYLHGVPFAIAPKEQTRVPMIWWMGPGFADSFEIDLACLRAQAARAWSHDNLFHTILGTLQVQTVAYDSRLDLAGPCRGR